VTVLVVGAGPTGLTAAALLAKHGVRTTVVERWPEVYPLPRAVHLDDEIMRILQQVGVAEAFLPLTRPALGMRLVDAQLRTMAQFDRSQPVGLHGFPQANMFDQPDLEQLLRDIVSTLPQIELRTGVELVGLERRTATLRDVTTGQLTTVEPRFVLGCDGANSTVRSFLGVEMQDLRFQERWLVVDGRQDRSLGTWDGVHQVCDPARAATFMQIGPDRYRWEFRLHEGESAESLDLTALLRPWGTSPDLEILKSVEYTFRARVAERWRVGDVFLLGDAAHQTPPFIGQGMGAGLRDAANLAWKLAAVLKGADTRILESYEAERAPHATALIRKAITVGWALTGGQGTAAQVRRVALAVLCRMPGLTRGVLDRGTPALKAGPLVDRRRFSRDLAGHSLPQPWVGFDDQLGEGLAVVTAGSPTHEVELLAKRLGAPLVVAPASLEGWLSQARAGGVVVRPDRVVLATIDRRGRLRRGAAQALALLTQRLTQS
jgi:3-(3-hydroxy-phenyl)propionate hydroxylase